jgi:cytochrome oxidase Cu insertion factor (SCO1/SenC/PrrC family)
MTVKKEFWMLLAMFILPIAFGTLFFYANPNYFSESTVNYGELVRPVIATDEDDIEIDGGASSLQGIWTMVYVSSRCDDACEKAVVDMKTIRTLMNADMRRIQRMIIIEDNSTPTSNDESLIKARVTSEKLTQSLKKYTENAIYLIDPIGNIMLYYEPQNIDIRLVIKDLKRLFKYSRIG